MMSAKPKAKFLTVVWGQAYIERFCSLSLPSFVSPGNLPALAAGTELEVVIMTCREDRRFFEGTTAFELLKASCPVRFVDIDDLVYRTAVYGVTLTLAYARPIIACGEDMVDTYFVFMNADFVLADGSLRSLLKPMMEGRRIVLGPSFRAVSEDVEPLLEARLDRQRGVLNMSCREMVALTLPHPHRTTVAKMRHQSVMHSRHPNQFFWKADEQTLLGRYFLIFMLCLRPERVIKTINSYCDYGFIPEMCPSGDEMAMGDSDDFFMLELQEREKEAGMLGLGAQPLDGIVSSLSEWTTSEHRRAASHDIVFHAGELPPGLPALREEAERFINEVRSRLGPPHSHVFHRYWSPGVRAWREYRLIPLAPPELEPVPVTRSSRKQSRRTRFETFLYHSGCVQDFHFLEKSIEQLCLGGGQILVAGKPSLLLGLVLNRLAERHPVEFVPLLPGLEKDEAAMARLAKEPRYDKCLVYDEEACPGLLKQSLHEVLARSSENAQIKMVFHPRSSANLPIEIGDVIDSLKLAETIDLRSVGGRLMWRCRKNGVILHNHLAARRLKLKHLLFLPKLLQFLLQNLFAYFFSKQGREQAGVVRHFTCVSIAMRLDRMKGADRPEPR